MVVKWDECRVQLGRQVASREAVNGGGKEGRTWHVKHDVLQVVEERQDGCPACVDAGRDMTCDETDRREEKSMEDG